MKKSIAVQVKEYVIKSQESRITCFNYRDIAFETSLNAFIEDVIRVDISQGVIDFNDRSVIRFNYSSVNENGFYMQVQENRA